MGEVTALIGVIAALIALVPVLFLIRERLARKHFALDLDYKNIAFARFHDPRNPALNGRLCLVVYVLRVVNVSDRPRTLKSIMLSYKHGIHSHEDESYVVPTGVVPDTQEPSIVLFNGIQNIVLIGWNNVRTKLGELEAIQPNGVLSGSAVFLFEPYIKEIGGIADLALVVSDFSGNRSAHPIPIQPDWSGLLTKGFGVMNTRFTVGEDSSIRWV